MDNFKNKLVVSLKKKLNFSLKYILIFRYSLMLIKNSTKKLNLALRLFVNNISEAILRSS